MPLRMPPKAKQKHLELGYTETAQFSIIIFRIKWDNMDIIPWCCTPSFEKALNSNKPQHPLCPQLADRLSPGSGRSSVRSNRHIPLGASRSRHSLQWRPNGVGIAQESSSTQQNHIWLVVEQTPLKNMKVNWDDYGYFQYMGKKCSKQPTSHILLLAVGGHKNYSSLLEQELLLARKR